MFLLQMLMQFLILCTLHILMILVFLNSFLILKYIALKLLMAGKYVMLILNLSVIICVF